MPRIKDKRIYEGRKNRNESIRKLYWKRWDEGLREQFIMDELILKWGLSTSTIEQIIKENGGYKGK